MPPLWSPEVYAHVLRLQRECDGRGIPVINRVDRLSLAGKFQGAQALARCGLRTSTISMATGFLKRRRSAVRRSCAVSMRSIRP